MSAPRVRSSKQPGRCTCGKRYFRDRGRPARAAAIGPAARARNLVRGKDHQGAHAVRQLTGQGRRPA